MTSLASRQQVYDLLAAAFRFPEPAAFDALSSGDWCRRLADEIGVELPGPAVDFDSFQSSFISLFEVGLGGAPCPLHSGHFGRDRMRTMEEVVRFYDFFGYRPARNPDRWPDHLVFELEFMAFLIAMEKHADSEQKVVSLWHAQEDFLGRHLSAFLPRLYERVSERTDEPYFREVVRITNQFVTDDLAGLNAHGRTRDERVEAV